MSGSPKEQENPTDSPGLVLNDSNLGEQKENPVLNSTDSKEKYNPGTIAGHHMRLQDIPLPDIGLGGQHLVIKHTDKEKPRKLFHLMFRGYIPPPVENLRPTENLYWRCITKHTTIAVDTSPEGKVVIEIKLTDPEGDHAKNLNLYKEKHKLMMSMGKNGKSLVALRVNGDVCNGIRNNLERLMEFQGNLKRVAKKETITRWDQWNDKDPKWLKDCFTDDESYKLDKEDKKRQAAVEKYFHTEFDIKIADEEKGFLADEDGSVFLSYEIFPTIIKCSLNSFQGFSSTSALVFWKKGNKIVVRVGGGFHTVAEGGKKKAIKEEVGGGFHTVATTTTTTVDNSRN